LIRIVVTAAMAIVTFLAPAAGVRAGRSTTGLPLMVSLADARIGSLLLRDGEQYVEAPRLATDIDITVSGPTLRARVTQIFNNPSKNWVEAIYVNPLPDGGAVDTLKMVIGDRIVVGEIKERVEAKVIYEAAKRSGRKATLIEEERPNIFTNSVANIGPGETVVVQIEYQEPVHRSGNTSSLRVPLVVAPRYNPAPITQTVDLGRGGWGKTNEPANDPVPDRERITAPTVVLHGAEDAVSSPRRSEGDMALFPATTARHVVASAGHFMPREQPGAVVDALRTLLPPAR